MSNSAPRTALITGSTGFVGSHLARRMVRDGWEVHVIVRPSSSLVQLKEAADKVVVHRHDGTMENMMAIMGEARPGVVFHLASLFISEHKPEDVAGLIESNLLFGTQLLEAMKAVGVAKLVNTGTSWQHYENEDYNPVNLYAATKQAFEDILRYYLESSDLKAITLKLFDTYGPDDPRPKLMNLLKRAAETGETLEMSPGEQMIDLVHVEDVVEAFVVAGRRSICGEVVGHEHYAVLSNERMKLKELVRVVSNALDAPVHIDWGKRRYRAREVMNPWNGSTLPNWRPQVSLYNGVTNTFPKQSDTEHDYGELNPEL